MQFSLVKLLDDRINFIEQRVDLIKRVIMHLKELFEFLFQMGIFNFGGFQGVKAFLFYSFSYLGLISYLLYIFPPCPLYLLCCFISFLTPLRLLQHLLQLIQHHPPLTLCHTLLTPLPYQTHLAILKQTTLPIPPITYILRTNLSNRIIILQIKLLYSL